MTRKVLKERKGIVYGSKKESDTLRRLSDQTKPELKAAFGDMFSGADDFDIDESKRA